MSNGTRNAGVTHRVTPPEVEVEGEGRRTAPIPTNAEEGRGWDGHADFEGVASELRRRGVNAGLRSLLVHCSLKGIVETIEWWDREQTSKTPPGQGLLVEMIRRGGVKTQAERVSAEERNRLYAESVVDWLCDQFPDLVDEQGYPHPGAVSGVIRLHCRFGKGNLTKEQHAATIRRYVAAWDKRYGPSETADSSDGEDA